MSTSAELFPAPWVVTLFSCGTRTGCSPLPRTPEPRRRHILGGGRPGSGREGKGFSCRPDLDLRPAPGPHFPSPRGFPLSHLFTRNDKNCPSRRSCRSRDLRAPPRPGPSTSPPSLQWWGCLEDQGPRPPAACCLPAPRPRRLAPPLKLSQTPGLAPFTLAPRRRLPLPPGVTGQPPQRSGRARLGR